jgi:uncharacterized protein YegL
MTKENFTSISVVLDRSGSMHGLTADTIGGFNSFLAEQKKAPGEAVLTLATFADYYTLIHDCLPIQEVPELTPATYQPSGSTALLDAIARTINATGTKLSAMKEEDRPSQVLLVIMTDGEENASTDFKHKQVMEMIKHQQETYSWTVVYLGANQDAIKVGTSYGISAGNTMSYAATSVGVASSYKGISSNTSSFRSSRAKSTQDFFSQAPPVKDTTDSTSKTKTL